MEYDLFQADRGRSDEQAQATMQFLLRLRERGIANVAVLRALETLPRENFVPHRHADLAWRDIALPIPCGQTMPEPYLVARMAESLQIMSRHRILEIGTGNGYSAAILSRLARQVVTVERFRSLALAAETRLAGLGLGNVRVFHGDGLALGDELGSFDRILIQGAVEAVPENIAARLVEGGTIVYGERPAGSKETNLIRLSQKAGAWTRERISSCRLQPLVAGVSAA
ncbi:MAG: hypothetical protein RL735_1117 [Pseudomonadota bacterium]|jgi:protein-L-isoaspartate(D-aspartate) O-methyltransferase